MTDQETFRDMLDRAGIPFVAKDIEWDQPHPVPGGCDITVHENMTIGHMMMVFSFDRDGELSQMAAYGTPSGKSMTTAEYWLDQARQGKPGPGGIALDNAATEQTV